MKRLAVYGTYRVKAKVKHRQRYWHKKKGGGKQRYWQNVMSPRWVVKSDGRFEFSGSGKELGRAVGIARHGKVPKGYQKVTANEFIKNPELYSEEGEWLTIEVESP